MYFESVQANYEGLSMLGETTLLETTCMQLFSETQMLCDEFGDEDYVLVSEADSGTEGKSFFGRMFDSIKNFLKKIKEFILKIIRSVLSIVLKPFGVKWAFLEGDKFAGKVKAEGGGGGGGGSSSSSSSSSSSPTIDVSISSLPGFDSVDVTVADVTDMVIKYGEAVSKARQGLADDGLNVLNSAAYKAYVNSYPLSKNVASFFEEFKDVSVGDVASKAKKLSNWISLLNQSITAECTSIRSILVYELDKTKKSHIDMDKDTNAAYQNMFTLNNLSNPLAMFDLKGINTGDDICAFMNTTRVHTHDGDKMGIMSLKGTKISAQSSNLMCLGNLVFNGIMRPIEGYINEQSTKTDINDVRGTDNIIYRMSRSYLYIGGGQILDAKQVINTEGPTLIRKLMNGAGSKLDGSDCKFTVSDPSVKETLAGLHRMMNPGQKSEGGFTAKQLINDKNVMTKINKESRKTLGFELDLDVFDTKQDFYQYIEYMKDLINNVNAQNTIDIYWAYADMLKTLENNAKGHSDKDDEGKDKSTTSESAFNKNNTPDEIRKKISQNLKGELADLKVLSNGIISAFKDVVKLITIVEVNAVQAAMTMRLLNMDTKLALAYHALGALSEAAKKGNTGSGETYIKEASSKLVKIINSVSAALKVTRPK